MSLIQTPWTSQPQQAVGIDWGNPITRGLMVAYDGLGNDVVSNSRFANTTHGIGLKGRGQNVSGSTTIPSLSGLVVPNQSEATFLVALTHQTIPAGYCGLFGKWDGLNSYKLSIGFYNNTLQIGNYPGVNISIGASAAAGYHVYAGSLAANGDYIGCVDAIVSATGNSGAKSFIGGSDAWRLGCWRGGALSENANGVYHAAFAWNRALSASELKSISQNPWQIFKPIPRRIFVPVATGGGTTAVTADQNASYTITGSVAADASAAYAIRAAVTADAAASYTITGSVAADASAAYAIRAAVTADATASYALRAAVAADSAASYALRAAAQADQAAAYAIRAAVASDLAGSYAIQTAGTVTTGLDAAYAVRGSVAGDISVGYQIAAAVQAEVAAAYAVRAAVQKDLSAWYSVSDSVTNVASDIVCTYAINGVSPSYPTAESIADAVRTMLLANPAVIADPVWTKVLP